MAHRRRRRDSAATTDDASDALSSELLARPVSPLGLVDVFNEPSFLSDFTPMNEVQDGRLFSPTISDAVSTVGTVAETRSIPGPITSTVAAQIGFDRPKEAVHCVRRRQRREVLFAKRLFKRGGGGGRKRDFWSQFKC